MYVPPYHVNKSVLELKAMIISLQLAEQAVPIVLYNTPFNLWNSSKWTPKILADDSKIVQVLSKKSQNNVFHYFANDQPLADFEQFAESKTFIEVIYPRERFFALLD